ncbi:MAG: hypothetical protein JWR04_423 [Rhodoglobus sp.]|nr:hypothetical protein [Rhodoglobus sp.]
MIRRQLVLASLLAGILALSACTPTTVAATSSPPTLAPTKTASATPTPTPTPTVVPKIALAAIAATADGMTLLGTDGSTIAYLDYFQPQDAAIAALTDALGFAPQPMTTEGTPNSDNVPAAYFDFEGLRVLGPPMDGGAGWTYRLGIYVGAVRGIPVTTVDGIQVGADAPSLESAYAPYARRIGSRLLIAIPDGSGYGVAIFADDPSTVITSILAPAGV